MMEMMNEADRIRSARTRFHEKFLYPQGMPMATVNDYISGFCPRHDMSFSVSYVKHMNDGIGCPACDEQNHRHRSMVRTISRVLDEEGILYERNVHFATDRIPPVLTFDFHLPWTNILLDLEKDSATAAEEARSALGSSHKAHQMRAIKLLWAQEMGYRIISIPRWKEHRVPEILEDLLAS